MSAVKIKKDGELNVLLNEILPLRPIKSTYDKLAGNALLESITIIPIRKSLES